MKIPSISFGNKIIDFDTARRQKKETVYSKPVTQGDSFTKSGKIAGSISDMGYTKEHPIPKNVSPGVAYFRETAPAVDDPSDAIFYSSQFNLLLELMMEKDEYKITPDEAAKEVIRLLKTGEPAKTLSKALYDDENYEKANSFFDAYYGLTQGLKKSIDNTNIVATIEILEEPIDSMYDDFSEELDTDYDGESEKDFNNTVDFSIGALVEIQSDNTSEKTRTEYWKRLPAVIRDQLQMEDWPEFYFSMQLKPNFDPDKAVEAFRMLVNTIAEEHKDFPRDPSTFIDKDVVPEEESIFGMEEPGEPTDK